MKRISLAAAGMAALMAICGAAEAQTLRFRPDSTFTVAQFTDTHIRTFNRAETREVYAGIRQVIRVEKPDLVILSGDIVTCKPCGPEWERLVKVMDGTGIPWVVMYGNHDAEQDLSRAGMSGIIAAGRHSLNTLNDAGELADDVFAVTGTDGEGTPLHIFCMDSHDYDMSLGHRSYAWFSAEQVDWLRNKCRKFSVGADGRPAPSFAFFHIPVPEYLNAWNLRRDPVSGKAPGSQCAGIKGEGVNCGEYNPGMFEAMVQGGSVIGMSAGHDHDNDYVAVHQGIALCYGRFSGSNTVYNHLPHGARLFRFREGMRGFETWIREYGGRVVCHLRFNGKTLEGAPRRDRSKPYGVWDEF